MRIGQNLRENLAQFQHFKYDKGPFFQASNVNLACIRYTMAEPANDSTGVVNGKKNENEFAIL